MTNIKEAYSLMGANASSPADFKLMGESTSLLDQKSGLQSYNRPLSKAWWKWNNYNPLGLSKALRED